MALGLGVMSPVRKVSSFLITRTDDGLKTVSSSIRASLSTNIIEEMHIMNFYPLFGAPSPR